MITGVVALTATQAQAANWNPTIPYPGGCHPTCAYYMYRGEHLVNDRDGYYHLEMQPDGNLVFYSNSHVCWASNTVGLGYYVKYSYDGHLYLISTGGTTLFDSGYGGSNETTTTSLWFGRFYVGNRFIAAC